MLHSLIERAEERKACGRSHVFDIVEHEAEVDHDGCELQVGWYAARELRLSERDVCVCVLCVCVCACVREFVRCVFVGWYAAGELRLSWPKPKVRGRWRDVSQQETAQHRRGGVDARQLEKDGLD